MILSSIKKGIPVLVTGIVFCLPVKSFSQILPINNLSLIQGFDEVCPKQKANYTFKHPTKDCYCDDITWSVSGGSFDQTPATTSPFNEKVKIEWGGNGSYGQVDVIARECYTELNNDNEPIYDPELNENSSLRIHKFDASMTEIVVFDKSNIDCESGEIIVELIIENSHVEYGHLNGYTWTVPQGWTIQPYQFLGNRHWGQSYPRIRINTNGNTTGQFLIKLDYAGPNYCASKSYTRGANIRIDACRPIISYNQHPTFYQSHSKDLTQFSFSQPTSLFMGTNYTYASEGTIELENNFEFKANANTELDLFIEGCSCDSEFHDPNRLGRSFITTEDIKNKKGGLMQQKSANDWNDAIDVESSVMIREQFSIYPNPNSGSFAVNFSAGTRTIMIRGISGVNIKQIIINDHRKELYTSVHLQDLSPGMYFVYFHGENGQLLNHQKFIIK
jgi:hypothetical protein